MHHDAGTPHCLNIAIHSVGRECELQAVDLSEEERRALAPNHQLDPCTRKLVPRRIRLAGECLKAETCAG